jgi:hypothetical protein
MRKIPNHGHQSSVADRQREHRAQRAGYRSTRAAQQSRVSEQEEQDSQPARPDAQTGPRPSPDQGP